MPETNIFHRLIRLLPAVVILLAAVWPAMAKERIIESSNALKVAPSDLNPLSLLDSGALRTADQLGVPYVDDNLGSDEAHPTKLLFQTSLSSDVWGRGPSGLFVKAGVKNGQVVATLQDKPLLGNRSLLARINFKSSQTGVAGSQHGSVELRLVVTNSVVNGRLLDSLRIHVDNGKFFVTDLEGQLVAGSNTQQAFEWLANTTYTLTAALFQKGIWCRLTGENVPDGRIEISVPDNHRWIPNPPGFSLKSNPNATGGELIVSDWLVTPIGPVAPKIGVIGDSITAGLVDTPEAESYVYRVTRGLGQDLTLNVGSGGATTSQDLARFPYEIAPFHPQVVWIEGGTNDITAGVTADAVFANMQRESALVARSDVAVFSTVPPRNILTITQEAQRQKLNAAIRSAKHLYVDRDAILADPLNPARLNPLFDSGDGTHPNAEGSRKVADAALPILRAALSSVQAP